MAGGGPCPGPLPQPRRRAALLARAAALCAVLRVAGGAAPLLACETSGRDAASCAALGDLYAATGGASWAARAGWRDAAAGRASDYCSFTGITCDSDGAVTQLVLTQNGLIGSLPDSLSALQNLTTLDVSDNVCTGTLPPSLGSLSRLTSLVLSRNIIHGSVPTTFAGLTALRTLSLETNTLNGTLPAFLGALPQLTALYVAHNYFTGAVPASLSTRGLTTLTLGSNMFDSAAFPQSLCPFACAADAPPFLCPVASPCAAAGNATCAPQCKYPACPAAGLGVDDFDFTRDKCASAAPRDSCLVCLPAIMDIYYQPPANVRDTLTMESCLVLYTPLYLAAGAQPSALGMIANCGNMFGFGWSSSTCPVSLPESAFTSLGSSCSSPAVACTTCVDDILRIFRRAGVDASSDAVRVAQYNVLGTCIDLHLLVMLASGANTEALAGIQACPSIAGFLVISTVSIGGVSATSFSAGIFGAAVAAVVNVRPSDVSVQNFTDSAGVTRRSLRASAVDVRFSIGCASAAQQAATTAALRLAISSLALTAALRQGGLPANGVALKDLILTAGPPATPALGSSSAAATTGTVAGSVVGSVVGAMLLIATVLVLRRRRRATRPPAFPPAVARSPDGSSHGRFRALNAPPFFSESSSSLLPSSTYSPMQGATSGSDDNASSGGGWRAVASNADEFQLCEQVGQGAVATVYRALWRGSEVAVKVWDLPPDGFVVHGTRGGTISVDAPEASFMREVELLSSLRHPNILAIYALVKQPPQMIMEYGAAGSLKDLLARSSLATLSWQRRMAICTSVASAVEFLHAQSPPIIHTDLKPANVVLTGHGVEALVAKVADFGVSWVARAEMAATPLLHGTPRYMAPEVARGQVITNSKAIDAYGVGMVMYDVAHVNTAGAAGAAEGEAERNDGVGGGLRTLFARESAGFVVAFAPHVPQPLRDLMRSALAVAPNERPGLLQLRVRLEALTVQAATW